MDCKYFVLPKPDDLGHRVSVERHHEWLKSMGITRYRGGHYITRNGDNYRLDAFRFEKREDAAAFKVMFGG